MKEWRNPLPPLSHEERAQLEADIVAHGVKTPIEVAEDGDLLDGWHRKELAERFKVAYETITIPGVKTFAEKVAYAIRVNVNRRNLTPTRNSRFGARRGAPPAT